MVIYRYIIAVFFCMFSFLVANAKVTGCTINFKNGEKKECLIDDTRWADIYISYRFTHNEKWKSILYKEISSIIIPDQDGRVTLIENVPYLKYKNYLKKNEKRMWHEMHCVVEYGDIILYKRRARLYEDKTGSKFMTSYVCRKNNMDYGAYFGFFSQTYNGSNELKKCTYSDDNLINLSEEFFGDNPELCQLIREGKLKLDNLEDIVHEYNSFKKEMSKGNDR